MPKKQEIAITILPDGRIEYTIQGIKGAHCESISQLLEILGRVDQEKKTGEYYESDRAPGIVIQH